MTNRLAAVVVLALAGCTRYVDLTGGGTADAPPNVPPDAAVSDAPGADAGGPFPDAAVIDPAIHA